MCLFSAELESSSIEVDIGNSSTSLKGALGSALPSLYFRKRVDSETSEESLKAEMGVEMVRVLTYMFSKRI